MSYVLLLNAGGTISAVAGEGGALQGSDTALVTGPRPGEDLPLAIRELCMYRGLSENMTYGDVARLAKILLLAMAHPEVLGVVIAHGTDTMEETAFLLDLFLSPLQKPVVLTGAQRAPAAADFDGRDNLRAAVQVASAPQARSLGVVIVFAGRIVAARDASKVHSSALHAFASRDRAGDLGRVGEGGLQLRPPSALPPRAQRWPIVEVLANVEIIPVWLGSGGVLIPAAINAGVAGLVLLALGTGNVPDAVVAEVEGAVAGGVLVVCASYCAGTVTPAYDSGARLQAAGVLSAGNLEARKARLLLAIALAVESDPEAAKVRFQDYLQS